MNEADWTYESKYTILKASPAQRERFREAIRAKLEEEHRAPASDEEVEEMAAFSWGLRAKELCDKADSLYEICDKAGLLYEEGVSVEEVMRLVKAGPQPPPD